MTKEQYRIIGEQSDKACNYLRKKGLDYFTVSVKTSYNGYYLIKFIFEDSNSKAIDHVLKTYPNALVSFMSQEVVQKERDHQDMMFFKAVGFFPYDD